MFDFTNYKALSQKLQVDVDDFKLHCFELQGIIDDATHENTALSAKMITQKVLIAELKKELADKQIWTAHLVEQNKELSNTLSTWRSKAKIALDNYTRELEKNAN